MKITLIKYLILFFGLDGVWSAMAQGPEIEWQKSFGGSAADKAMAAIQTLDGGYLVTGSTESVDGDVTDNKVKLNCWLIKLKNTGTLDWKKCVGGETAHQANDMVETKDRCIVLAGSTMLKGGNYTGEHGNDDYWITKLNVYDNMQWSRVYGGKSDDVAKSIQQTTDGGYIVAGWGGLNGNNIIRRSLGGTDFWLMKLNKQGGIVWQNSLGGSGMDNASGVVEAADRGYIAAGYSSSNNFNVTNNHGSTDCWLVKVDTGGIKEWRKSIGGSGLDYAYSIRLTKDKGFIIAGATESTNGDVQGNHGGSDAWIIKTDSAGKIDWQKCYGGKNNDVAYFVEQTKDGGYIFSGSSNSVDGDVTGNHGGTDVWIVKLDNKGNLQWQKSLGGTKNEQSKTVHQTNDGGYIISAFSESSDGDCAENKGNYDFWVIKLKP